jgi:hypothetical protein
MFNSLAVAYAMGTAMVEELTQWVLGDLLVMLVLAFPGWYLISLGQAWLVILVIALGIGFGVNTMLGPQCAMLPEMFGNKRGYLGVAVSREFSEREVVVLQRAAHRAGQGGAAKVGRVFRVISLVNRWCVRYFGHR